MVTRCFLNCSKIIFVESAFGSKEPRMCFWFLPIQSGYIWVVGYVLQFTFCFRINSTYTIDKRLYPKYPLIFARSPNKATQTSSAWWIKWSSLHVIGLQAKALVWTSWCSLGQSLSMWYIFTYFLQVWNFQYFSASSSQPVSALMSSLSKISQLYSWDKPFCLFHFFDPHPVIPPSFTSIFVFTFSVDMSVIPQRSSYRK